MSYLGNAPARSFISFERQVFTIVNSQTAYALSHSVTNENDIRLVVNNVVQEPGSGKAYTATGTALTLSAALTNGTDEMYCVFLGRATATSAPGAGSIGTAQLASDSVTLAKMASGTDGNIISYDASGNPVAVATGNDGQVLTSAGAGAPPVFETPASAANTPMWSAVPSSNQTLSNTTNTVLNFQTEVTDTNNAFASNKFTVPSGQAGQYFLTAAVRINDMTDGKEVQLSFKKNGGYEFSEGGTNRYLVSNSIQGANGSIYFNHQAIVTLAVGDYIEVATYQNSGSNKDVNNTYTRFSGFKLIT